MPKPFGEAESHRLLYANSHRGVTAIGKLLGVHVFGQENIPKEDGGLIVANHRHWTDVLVLPSAVPERHVTMVARHEVMEEGLQGAYFKALGALPVHRFPDAKPGELKAIIRRAKDGHLVALFPEETREKDRKKALDHADMKEFRPGAPDIARLAGVVTVPAALYGLDQGWTRHRGVAFGNALDKPGKDEGEEWLAEVRAKIEELYERLHYRQF